MFAVAVDSVTEEELESDGADGGVIFGFTNIQNRFIRVDQGLNTPEISYEFAIDPDLRETRYLVEIDNRLGSIATPAGGVKTPSFIDDDNVAVYNFSLGTDGNMVSMINNVLANGSPITGPRGTKLTFAIKASMELNSSTFLFTKLGTSGNTWLNSLTYPTATFYYIDSTIRVTGATTGYRLDIPIRFVKKA